MGRLAAPSAVVRIVASAELPVGPEEAQRIILDPKVMAQWLTGARGLKADPTWPFFNTQLSWETHKGTALCSARVLDNHLPEFLRVDVATPSHSRVVTHRFVPIEHGGTRYERIVDAELYGVRKWFGIRGLRRQIEAEVAKAASLVPPPTSSRRTAKSRRAKGARSA